jgi:hypothetical protein
LLLPSSERAVLADRLLASLEHTSPEIREAWVEESQTRMHAYESGAIEAIDGEDALSALKNQFRQ